MSLAEAEAEIWGHVKMKTLVSNQEFCLFLFMLVDMDCLVG